MNLLRDRKIKKALLQDQSGQSIVEYILVMFLVVSIVMFIFGAMKKNNFFFNKFTKPLVAYMIYNYKYGDASAQGWDEGKPHLHIQISQPNPNATFRLFQPEKK
ncbi:MAG: TadE/TadG family type IV pilus assembly protein [Bdellovibrionota bacterium]